MMKYNPLLQSSNKKKVEIVRPQIIQNTIKQTNDNIVIEKLVNQKLLIGHEEKIISSPYTVNDIFKELQQSIPTPLQAGSNVSITNGVVSASMYDDTDVRNEIANTQLNIQDHYTKLSQNDNDLANKMYKECEKLFNKQKGIVNEVDKVKKSQGELQEIFKDNAYQFDNDIQTNYKYIDTVKEEVMESHDVINNKIQEIQEQYDKRIDEINSRYENNREYNKQIYIDTAKKIEEIQEHTKNQQIKDMSIVSEKINNIMAQNQREFSSLEKKFDNKINNIVEFLDDKYKTKIEATNDKINKLQKTIEKLNVDIVTVKELDPNSKQLQKVIKQLTDKVSLIDKHFKFNIDK